MALLPPYPTHLVVRWIHVLGMAALFGGAVLCWGLFRRRASGAASTAPWLAVASTYEWVFWAGAGLLVLTGVGNLGAMAPGIPGPGTTWGTAFSVKLVGVVVLLVGSLVRTVGVVGLQRAPDDPASVVLERLASAYAVTALLLLAVVALAEVIAHG